MLLFRLKSPRSQSALLAALAIDAFAPRPATKKAPRFSLGGRSPWLLNSLGPRFGGNGEAWETPEQLNFVKRQPDCQYAFFCNNRGRQLPSYAKAFIAAMGATSWRPGGSLTPPSESVRVMQARGRITAKNRVLRRDLCLTARNCAV